MKAILSSCVAALVVITVSLLVDRCGGRVAGVLGTVPHVAVVGTVAFSTSLSRHEFEVATFSMCFGMFFNAVYLAVVVLVCLALDSASAPREAHRDSEEPTKAVPDASALLSGHCRLLIALGSGLAAYGILVVFVLTAFRPKDRPAEQVRGCAVAALCAQCLVGLALVWCRPSAPRAKRRSPLWMLGCRGVVTFVIFFTAMAVSKTVPSLAGILVNLPIVTTVVLVTVWLSQGEAVALGTCGPMALGIMSASSYALTAGHLIPTVGPAIGATISWLLCVLLVTLPVLAGLEALSKHREAKERPSSGEVALGISKAEVAPGETKEPPAAA